MKCFPRHCSADRRGVPVRVSRVALLTAAITVASLAVSASAGRSADVPVAGTAAGSVAAGGVTAGSVAAGRAPAVPPPARAGTLRISGVIRDGATVYATGVRWHVPRLPRGMTLLSFEVGYSWQSCLPSGTHCVAGADSTAAPFAARGYVVGHADTGRLLRVTETATEVVETARSTFTFQVISRSVSRLAAATVRAYPRHRPPASAFVNGTPQARTSSAEEYFQVAAAHENPADGRTAQWYRIDRGRWRAMPASRVFYTGHLAVGPHQVAVRTANRAGATEIRFGWRVVPLPPPAPCRRSGAAPGGCWYPPHLASDHRPMRWDWQIGRVTPLERTGREAVDIYDIDGFLTTRAQVAAIKTRWRASTLRHPRTVCYLDLAWEDYRPDASPGGYFPAATLGHVYFGFPEERWVDLRQLDALKPMLTERIAMCARKGFDTVELDDIDSFDPPSTTGFRLTPGDAENFLAYAFNEIHRYGMTGLWKNSPYLAWWGREYADGAVVEECYVDHACFASQFQGSRQYGITCTSLRSAGSRGGTPCGWDDFTADVTREQPTGKWVGEAEYVEDGYVCDPGQRCPAPREFTTFCRAVFSAPHGFAAVKFDADLDGRVFHPCP